MPTTGILDQFSGIEKEFGDRNLADFFIKKISLIIGFATQASIYSSKVSSTDLNTAQCLVLSLLYALSTKDMISSVILIQISAGLEHLKSKYIVVWLSEDYIFDQGVVQKGLNTLRKLIFQKVLEVPQVLLKVFCVLAKKYVDCTDAFPFIKFQEEDEQTFDVKLCRAVKNNNIAEIISTATSGGNVNLRTSSGGSLFHLAVSGSCIEAIAVLGYLKADIEARDHEGHTPLLMAVIANNDRAVRALLSAGAQTDKRFMAGNSVLHVAASQGSNKAMRVLLGSVSCINSVNNRGETPLILAVMNINEIGVKLLLKSGADPNKIIKGGNSVLHIACTLNSVDNVKELIKAGAKTDSMDGAGLMPLHLCQNKAIIEALHSCGVSLDIKSTSLDSALHLAVINGFDDVAEALIIYGATIDIQNKNGETPLLLASLKGKFEAVNMLLSYGADPNAALKAFYWAAERGKLVFLQAFIFAGVDMGATLQNGWNVLHIAVLKGHGDIVDFLLECDVNGFLVKAKCTYSDWHYQSVSGININGASQWTALHLACFHGNFPIVMMLLHSDVIINAQDSNKLTPLHLAVHGGYLQIVQALLSKRAKITKTTKNQTVCEIAADRGHLDVMKLLVQKGANLNETNSSGWSPLHCAVKRGKLDIVEYLLENGANINFRTSDNYTPLSLSTNTEISQLLRSRGAT